MKVGVIGDIHCDGVWKKLVLENNDIEKWVFLGDYVDSFHHTDEQMLNNLSDIIQYKKDNDDKVILLMGNHDINYAYPGNYMCSGFRAGIAPSVTHLFQTHKELFVVAFQYKSYLFTHAGASKKWYQWMKPIFDEYKRKFHPEDFAELLNMINDSKDQHFLHSVGAIRGGMRFTPGGISWADKTETMEGIPQGFHQVVGHTPCQYIEHYNKFMGTTYKDRSITYCDVLQKRAEIYKLEA